jgi:hypothetical protein
VVDGANAAAGAGDERQLAGERLRISHGAPLAASDEGSEPPSLPVTSVKVVG